VREFEPASKDFFLLFSLLDVPYIYAGSSRRIFPPGAWWTRFGRVSHQASWMAEGGRAGREGRNPLHGASAPSVAWHWPSRLKQGLGSACCVEAFTAVNNSGEISPGVIDLRRNVQRRYPKMRPLWEQGSPIQKCIPAIDRWPYQKLHLPTISEVSCAPCRHVPDQNSRGERLLLGS
jgi:hypothetical protein